MHPSIEKLVRPHYLGLSGYVSAGMAGKNPANIYLNANENPYELPGLEGSTATLSRSRPSFWRLWRDSTA